VTTQVMKAIKVL